MPGLNGGGGDDGGASTVFCRSCGREIDANASVCPECDNRQDTSGGSSEADDLEFGGNEAEPVDTESRTSSVSLRSASSSTTARGSESEPEETASRETGTQDTTAKTEVSFNAAPSAERESSPEPRPTTGDDTTLDSRSIQSGSSETNTASKQTIEGESRKREAEQMYCRDCGDLIARSVSTCPHCGSVPTHVSSAGESQKSPLLAGGLTFFIIGLGQVYLGKVSRGVGLFLAAILAWLFTIAAPPAVVLLIGVWAYAVYDAYAGAKRMNSPTR